MLTQQRFEETYGKNTNFQLETSDGACKHLVLPWLKI